MCLFLCLRRLLCLFMRVCLGVCIRFFFVLHLFLFRVPYLLPCLDPSAPTLARACSRLLFRSFALSLFHSFALSLFRSFALSLSCSLALALSLSRSLALLLSRALALSFPCPLVPSCYRSLLSLAPKFFLYIFLFLACSLAPSPSRSFSCARAHFCRLDSFSCAVFIFFSPPLAPLPCLFLPLACTFSFHFSISHPRVHSLVFSLSSVSLSFPFSIYNLYCRSVLRLTLRSSLFICVHMCTCVYICIYSITSIYMFSYTYLIVCLHVFVSACMYIYSHMHVHVFTYAYMYVLYI